MQLVHEGLCPECLDQHNPRNRRLLKKGIKRECSQGHLIIYGNPEYVAYYRVEEENSDEKKKTCRNCDDKLTFYDKKHDELVCVQFNCENAGTVLSGPPHESHGRWVKYPHGNRFDFTDIDATYDPHDI